MLEKIISQMQMAQEALSFIRKHTSATPEIGIILGTGLNIGDIIEDEGNSVSSSYPGLNIETVIPYEEIPYFPLSTVESHSGKLAFGKMSDKQVVVMQGRFHYYEGYTMQQITFPIRVMKFLGVKTLLISNACGSMNPYFRKGELMLIEDHINLLGMNPLIGVHENDFGPRFPDMSEPYSHKLIKIAEKIGMEKKIKLNKGVYAAMTGPSLETRSEYRFLRMIGADVVGMSTIPENIVARQMGMEVMGISVITDECYPDALKPANIDDIIETAKTAEPRLTLLLKEIVGEMK
jgi:purine-nucleoside phosphorylase